jgi:hypothetical protein
VVGLVLRAAGQTTQPAGQAPLASQPAKAAPYIPPDPPLSAFWLDELSFDLGFDGQWRRRRTGSQRRDRTRLGYRQRDDMWRLEETIGMHAAGGAVHDRFLTYDIDALWGLSQEAYRETRPGRDLSNRPHGDILEYDARATLLPAGKISADFFALQLDDRVPRPFLPSLDRRRERYGATLSFNDRVLPMRLSFEDTFERLTSGDSSLLDDQRDSERLLTYEATWHVNDRQQLQINYEYSDRRAQFSGTRTRFDTTRNYLTLDHALAFGEDDGSRLETIARFQDETGDLARDVYELAPQLRLQHDDNFFTTYRGQVLRESFEGSQLELFRGDVGATRTWGESLTTLANLYGLRQNVERGSNANEWGATANLSYHKDNRLGRFTGSLNYAHTHLRSNDDARDGVVFNEALSFRDPLPAYLAHTNVRPASIVVIDAETRRVLRFGSDYVVLRIGKYTALSRVRTGRILDRGTVLVSYRYRAARGFELGRDRVDVRLQQSFGGGLTAYYAGSLQHESIDRRRLLGFEPRDVNRHRVGLSFAQKRWSTSLEYEYNDDDIDPFQAVHLTADATVLERAAHTLDLRGGLSYFDFAGESNLEGRHAVLLDLTGSYRYLLGDDLELSTSAAYRYEDDSLFGRTNGVDLTAGLNWKIGMFTAVVDLEYDALKLSGSNDETFAAWIKLRRDIPVISRGR